MSWYATQEIFAFRRGREVFGWERGCSPTDNGCDVAPVLGRAARGIDAERLDGVDRL
jgi:hypothetical protein